MTNKHDLQGIFYSKHPDDGWLYHVRWPVKDKADAIARTKELSRREGKPAKVHVEDWNWPKGDLDGFHFSTE